MTTKRRRLSATRRYTRPERWLRHPSRGRLEGDRAIRMAAARLLDQMGASEDVRLLLRAISRETSKSGRDRRLGRALARGSPREYMVDDLGRVTVRLGGAITGSANPEEGASASSASSSRGRSSPRHARKSWRQCGRTWTRPRPSIPQSIRLLPATSVRARLQRGDICRLRPSRSQTLCGLTGADRLARVRACADAHRRIRARRQTRDVASAQRGVHRQIRPRLRLRGVGSRLRDWLHVAYLHVVETQIEHDIDAGDFERGIAMARRASGDRPRQRRPRALAALTTSKHQVPTPPQPSSTRSYANVLRR